VPQGATRGFHFFENEATNIDASKNNAPINSQCIFGFNPEMYQSLPGSGKRKLPSKSHPDLRVSLMAWAVKIPLPASKERAKMRRGCGYSNTGLVVLTLLLKSGLSAFHGNWCHDVNEVAGCTKVSASRARALLGDEACESSEPGVIRLA
jgi:hypothetical protein